MNEVTVTSTVNLRNEVRYNKERPLSLTNRLPPVEKMPDQIPTRYCWRH